MFNQILTVFITALLPVSELRGAIPVGLAVWKLSPWLVYLTAVIGNIVPVFLLLWFWGALAARLSRRFAVLGKFFYWLFERTRKKIYARYQKWGDLALIIFVAIPLPITGAWTGTVAAWLLGIPYKRALGLIFVGILISGLVVTGLTLGIIHIT